MALIPAGNKIIPYLYANNPTAKALSKYYPAIVITARSPYPNAAAIKQLRADAAAVGNPNIKIFAYIMINGIINGNPAIIPMYQYLHDNPQFFLLQQGTGLPLGADVISGYTGMSRTSRGAVDSLNRTYPEAYADIVWADFLSQDGYDGVMLDGFTSFLYPLGVWNTRTTATIIAGSTSTSLVTNGTPSLLGLDGKIGRFTSGVLNGKFFFTNGSGSTSTTLGLQVVLGGVATPVTPAVNDTFEIVATMTALTAGAPFGADLYLDQRQFNQWSAQGNDEILYTMQLGLRRLAANAAAAGKPNFVITFNAGTAAGRYAYTREMVADGILDGILYEMFNGNASSPDPLYAVSLANEVCNTLPSPLLGGFPMTMVYASGTTDYLRIRNGYALCRMTDAWIAPHMNFGNVVADEFLVDLSTPIDPPQITPQSGGYLLRRYAGGAAIYNPSLATISNISVPGYRLFYAGNAPYAGQDTTFNNGTATVTLPTLCGAILVPA